MNRRHALCCSAAIAAGLFTGLTAASRALNLEEGLSNPCLGPLPPDLARHDLMLKAFEGLDPAALWDTHCHLLGTGDAGSGCTVNARMHEWWHPAESLRRRMILRLLHGSDHPLPGVMPLYAPQRLAEAGLLDAAAVVPLHRMRGHNPLLFDFVLKRHLRLGTIRLPDSVFATRGHFARTPARPLDA